MSINFLLSYWKLVSSTCTYKTTHQINIFWNFNHSFDIHKFSSFVSSRDLYYFLVVFFLKLHSLSLTILVISSSQRLIEKRRKISFDENEIKKRRGKMLKINWNFCGFFPSHINSMWVDCGAFSFDLLTPCFSFVFFSLFLSISIHISFDLNWICRHRESVSVVKKKVERNFHVSWIKLIENVFYVRLLQIPTFLFLISLSLPLCLLK